MKKKLTTIFLLCSLCLATCACNIIAPDKVNPNDSTQNDVLPSTDNTTPSNTEPTDTNPTDTDQESTPPGNITSWNYTIIEQNGKHYIVFEDPTVYDNLDQVQLAEVQFNSLAEFKNSVINNKLSIGDKEIVATFAKDEVGILTPDFNNLFEPYMPDEFQIDLLLWEGRGYTFLAYTPSGVEAYITYHSQENYNKLFQYDFENYFDRDLIVVTETIKTDDGKTITTYYTALAELKDISYTISKGDKTIIVQERYRLESQWLPVSDTIPSQITLYGTEGDAHYIIDLFEFEEKPSEEWLFEFGMQPYVDTDVAEK